jgi:hypothetical protein
VGWIDISAEGSKKYRMIFYLDKNFRAIFAQNLSYGKRHNKIYLLDTVFSNYCPASCRYL